MSGNKPTSMRLLTSGLLLVLLALSGCCKMICLPASLSLMVTGLHNTPPDSIHVKAFQKGSSFEQPIDSISIPVPAGQPDTVYVSLPERFPLTADYRISLTPIGRNFTITNITTASERCSCGGHRQAVKYCDVDGVRTTGELIPLRK